METFKETFLIVGLGSMGQRRIRNLVHNGITQGQIFGIEPNSERAEAVAKEYGIQTMPDFKTALSSVKPTAVIISTPPDKHAPFFLECAKQKINFFVEVPTTAEGYAELIPLLDNTFVAAPSCTFRYFPAVKRLKELLALGTIGKPLVFNHYLGQYLPDWHPFEDYRKVYFAQKETGGAREMFFYELVWLTYLFNSSIKEIAGQRGTISDLEISAEDIFAATLAFENKVVGTLTIDLLNRRAERTLKIVGTNGTIDWDWIPRTITTFTAADKKINAEELPEGKKVGQYNTAENSYEEEIADFLAAVRGQKAFPHTYPEDLKILNTITSVKEI
jgi:predicted dehydrogenase